MAASLTTWSTRWRGFSEAYGFWNTIWILRWVSTLGVVMSLPSNASAPLVAGSRPAIMRPTVDLPQPDSPTSPSTSPLATLSDTSLTAYTRASAWRDKPTALAARARVLRLMLKLLLRSLVSSMVVMIKLTDGNSDIHGLPA